MRLTGHCPAAELDHAHRDSAARPAVARIREDQVSADVSRVVHASKSDLMARGVAFDLLQMDKRVGPQCETTEYEDLSGEEGFSLDDVVTDDMGSTRVDLPRNQRG